MPVHAPSPKREEGELPPGEVNGSRYGSRVVAVPLGELLLDEFGAPPGLLLHG